MGWSAARKLRRARRRAGRVLAIEMLTRGAGAGPARAARRRRRDGRGRGGAARAGAGPGPDRHLAPEIEAAVAMVADGELLAAAESAVGHLD